MRIKRAWRYYCDHCDKSGGSKGHMVRHEATCTANPARVCGICQRVGVAAEMLAATTAALQKRMPAPPALLTGDALGDLIATVGRETENAPHDVSALRALVDGCPACMLAAVRQSGCQTVLRWSYADEKQRYWAAQPSRRKRHSLDDDR